ncbi:MAG TPA: glycosyltransferase family 2 protein [Herpetosiphonaceae bacterium]
MRASVIVVSYNSRLDLPACLDSILGQLTAEDELIVVDNGSTDGSADLVAARYPEVTLIRSTNEGYAGGNNRGTQAAQGEYLVILNPDTALLPGAIDALITPLAGSAEIGLTTACIVFMDRPMVVNTCGNTVQFTGLTYCRGAGQPRSGYTTPAEVDAVSGAAFAIRRSLFDELGGFDAQFFMYVEDTDLSWRARSAGYRCLYVPGAIVKHAYQPGYSPNKAFHLDRNRHLMLLKNLERGTYLRMLPGLLLSEVVTAGFLALNGPRYWGVKLRVYRWLFAERRSIRLARRAVQARRTHSDREIIGRMTYRLEFGQLANRTLARMAELVFHPAFWIARRLVTA